MHRAPPYTTASVSDFRTSGWKDATLKSQGSYYFSLCDVFYNAAVEAKAAGLMSRTKVLSLLGDVCCLRLDSSKRNEPLVPTYQGTSNAVSLDGFSEADLALLDSILPEIDHALLRARVADVLWLARKPREVRFANIAIDSYCATSLSQNAWLTADGENLWRRAIVLSNQIQSASGSRLSNIRIAILAEIELQLNEGDAAPSMIQILLDNDLADGHHEQLAQGLIRRGENFLCTTAPNRFMVARRYFTLAKRCLRQIGNEDRSTDMTFAISKSFSDEAISRINTGPGSYLVAASFYGDAIKVLVAIPRSLRLKRGIDITIAKLQQSQREIAAFAIGDFVPMKGEAIDLSEEIRATETFVAGKDTLDALCALAQCSSLARRKLTEEDVRTRMRASSFSRLFASRKIAADGRVVATSPAADELDNLTKESCAAVWSKMVEEHCTITIPLVVQCSIIPALFQIQREHLITDHDLVNIVSFSGLVPRDRIRLVAKGLKAGFDGDFVVALHLLVPQLEHLVRIHLQNFGTKTNREDDAGLQMELGLASLANLPAMITVFGEDLGFEIQALFCDGFGSNLRNEVAHGLLEDGGMRSAPSVYAWWLIFRMIYLPYYLS